MKLNPPAAPVSGPVVERLKDIFEFCGLSDEGETERPLILVAVSGGSDSLALLLATHAIGGANLHAVTVDHGLRPQSAQEAQAVAKLCEELAIPHETLRWQSAPTDGKASANAARSARYDLLSGHALNSGADVTLLGHTANDQIETLLMRAARLKPQSGSRGMSGMPSFFSYDSALFFRPCLHMRRETLRTILRDVGMTWIDDPTNEDTHYERVRVRRAMQHMPAQQMTAILRFADLANRHTQWLTDHMVKTLPNFVGGTERGFEVHHQAPDGSRLADKPRLVLREMLSLLIWVAGGMPSRPSLAKLADLVEAIQSGTPLRKTVGRALVNVGKHVITIRREDRDLPALKPDAEAGSHYDGRFRMTERGLWEPYTIALERFRPAGQDDLAALLRALTAPLAPPRLPDVHNITRK
ncbi:MAG: tRNA lysidine(34) synthetase TilS [Pseudomonadota bacterium]